MSTCYIKHSQKQMVLYNRFRFIDIAVADPYPAGILRPQLFLTNMRQARVQCIPQSVPQQIER